MTRIVILGGGFAGAYCAQALQRGLDGIQADVLLIDRNNYFVFYPLLIEAGTGSLEPRHAVVPLRSFLRKVRFRMAETTSVDLARRIVTARVPGEPSSSEIPYDHLVLALGSVTRLPDVPGLRQYGFEMKSLPDAVLIRDRAIQMLERADAAPDEARRRALLRFLVVGANFTGVEVAAELQVFLQQALRRYPNVAVADIDVTLVEMADRILPALDASLASYAAEKMRRRGIGIRLKSSVARIDPEEATLSGGEKLPCLTVIWCAGIRPHPLIAGMGLPTTPQGYLQCDGFLRVREHDNIWAVGDGASIPNPDGGVYPPTAQHALREGKHVAANLKRVLSGGTPRPFRYTSKGSLVPLGCRSAVAEVFGFKISGFLAYFLWRTYYWMMMPGWSRKLRLAFDWTADLFFKRDIVQLGIHRRTREEQDGHVV
ncbi:MAG TPA: NAD(P)/FAD-dependent oxidoreductase [Candidatus Polarisedimenticolia bacterium]|nr:NAD(P)/FAD-dependent oxidoreductase [Candidatus Polarisedimenticolia bacterium]